MNEFERVVVDLVMEYKSEFKTIELFEYKKEADYKPAKVRHGNAVFTGRHHGRRWGREKRTNKLNCK